MSEGPGVQSLRRHPLSGLCKCLTLVLALRFALHKVVSVYLLPVNKYGSSDLVGDNPLSVVAPNVLSPSIFPLL